MQYCGYQIATKMQKLTTITNQAYSDYKHVLANILRSLSVAGTPPVEARSPGRRRINVENAPVARRSPAGDRRVTGGATKTERRIRQAGAAGPPSTGRRRGAFSTLLRRPGLRASTGGVLAT